MMACRPVAAPNPVSHGVWDAIYAARNDEEIDVGCELDEWESLRLCVPDGLSTPSGQLTIV
jgi:hypothetical protein